MFDNEIFLSQAKANVFHGQMNDSQTAGALSLVSAWFVKHAQEDTRWLAYALATAYHEADFTMQPIDEVGHGAGHAYGVPDAVTGLAYYGRGYVQLTWKANYATMGVKVGADLVNHPELALIPATAAAILFQGMIDGDFTGVGLRRYFNETADDPMGARRIVNGTDRAAKVAAYHSGFLAALLAAGATAPFYEPSLA